jgi:hypothetical protein
MGTFASVCVDCKFIFEYDVFLQLNISVSNSLWTYPSSWQGWRQGHARWILSTAQNLEFYCCLLSHSLWSYLYWHDEQKEGIFLALLYVALEYL